LENSRVFLRAISKISIQEVDWEIEMLFTNEENPVLKYVELVSFLMFPGYSYIAIVPEGIKEKKFTDKDFEFEPYEDYPSC